MEFAEKKDPEKESLSEADRKELLETARLQLDEMQANFNQKRRPWPAVLEQAVQ